MPHAIRRRTYLALHAIYGLPLVSTPAEAQVATRPSELEGVINEVTLAGSARMRYFGFNVCDLRLWVTPGFQAKSYWKSEVALEIAYLRKLNGNAIAQRSLDEMRRSGSIQAEDADRWLGAMTTVFPDVSAGDRITGLHTPNWGARFWLNGQPRPAIKDPEFSRLFFGIWLADHTSEPRLRAELLSGLAP